MKLNKPYADFRGRNFKFDWDYRPLKTLLLIVAACLALDVVGSVLHYVGSGGLQFSRLFGLGEVLAHPLSKSIFETVGYAATFLAVIALFSSLSDAPGSPRIVSKTAPGDRDLTSWWYAAGNAGSAMLLKVLILALMYLVLPLPDPYSPAGEVGKNIVGTAAFIPFAFTAIVLAPLLEELLFRWLFQNSLRAAFRNAGVKAITSDFLAVVLSAAIFAAAHYTLTGFPGLFLSGLFLGAMYRETGDLRSSILLHALNNTLAMVALVIASKL